MTWILLSLIAPFFWAVSNTVDQFLVRGAFDGSPWVYTLFQGTFYLPLTLCFPFIFPVILQTSFHDALLLMLLGTTWIPAVGFYAWALKGDDASVAVPIFNVIPFMILVGGWLLLGETISTKQIIAGSVLVIASTAITWDFHAKRLRLKTAALMFGSCVLYATYTLTARHQIETLHWATVYFWYAMGFSSVCWIVNLCVPYNRNFFITFMRERPKIEIVLSAGQSWLDVAGLSCITAAIAAAPAIALVSFVASLQPLYVLAVGVLAVRFSPTHFQNHRLDRVLAWKIACITVMLAALFVLLN